MRSLTKSKEAILRACSETVCGALFSGTYFPTIKLVPTIRQVMGSGFFCDAGVKKFATVFSVEYRSDTSELLDKPVVPWTH